MTNVAFEAFPCFDFDGGKERYMKADVAVPCGLLELSRTHSGFERTSVPVQAGRVSMLGGLHAHDGAALYPCPTSPRARRTDSRRTD